MAQLVIGAAGAAVGFLAGGPIGAQVGWALGSLIGGSLSAPDQQGPRLAERTVQLASYGSPIAKVYGSGRLAGTLIWSTDIIEAASTESAKGGPEVTSYSYSVSCAVAICEGTIGSIRRIWADAKLVYDIRDGATSEATAASYSLAEYMTIYLGTEDQLPDATIEAVEGAGNVEAYRGTAYVVFDGLPLADYGNRIPNFTFEITTEEPTSVPVREPLALQDWAFMQVDPLTGTQSNLPYPVHGVHHAPMTFEVLKPNGLATVYTSLGAALAAAVERASEPDSLQPGSSGWAAGTAFVAYGTSSNQVPNIFSDGASVSDDPRTVTYYFGVAEGAALEVDNALTSPISSALLCPLNQNMRLSVARYDYSSTFSGIRRFGDPSAQFPFVLNNCGYPPLPESPVVSKTLVSSPFIAIRAERVTTCRDNTCWPGDPCLSVEGQAQAPGNENVCIKCGGGAGFNYQYGAAGGTFRVLIPEPIFNGSQTVVVQNASGPVLLPDDENYSNETWWREQALDRGINLDGLVFGVTFGKVVSQVCYADGPPEVAAGSALLSSIVSNLCVQAGLTTGQIDVTELTDEVLGFTRGRVMSARAAIESLRSAFYFDAVESGNKIRFVKRGAAPVASLTLDDIGAGQDGATEPLEHDRAQESELPSAVAVAYQSPVIDFQTGVQQARRRVGGSQQINQVELPIVLTDEKAAEVADVLLYDSWASRTRRTFRSGLAFAQLEPTDIVEVNDGAAVYELRIIDKVEDGGVITFACRDNDVAAYAPDSVAAPPAGGGSAVRFDGPTKLYLLDIPILLDANDDPGYYMAATGYFSGFRGAEVFRSANAGVSYTPVRDATARVVAGHADTVLGDYAGGNTVDEINSVDVTILSGELSSITRAQLLNNGNAALVGDELIQFQRATLQSGSTYRLTGLLRGRKGTERHMATHAVDERFVLLSASSLYRISAPQTEIDEASVWKGVTFGSGLSDAYEVNFTNTAVGLMPLAPVGLFAAPVGGQYVAQWVRRTRYDATWRPLVDAPIGETTEAYQIDVYTAAGTLVNTLSSTTPSVTFGSPEKDLMYEVGLIWPGNFAGYLYAVEYTINTEARFLRMASDGSIDAATAPFAGHVWRAVYDGAGEAYLITSETDVSDTYVTAIVLYRVDLATMTVTASFDLFAAVSQAGYEIVHDGTDLWSVTITGATLRKHNPTTLAITGTHVLTNTGTRTTNLAHDGAGTFFVGCKDWTRIIAYQPATTTTVWDIDFAASAGAIESIWFVNGMLFITGTLNTVAVDPATGAVVQSHSEVSAGPIVAYGPYAAYVELIATASPGRVDYTLGDVRLLETTGGTFVRSQPIDGDSLALVGTDDGDLLVTAYGIGVEVAYRYSAPADLAGGRIDVYQMSSVLGRGYPATFTL